MAASDGGSPLYAYGIDSLQALLLAITGIRLALDAHPVGWTWQGGEAGDHGVPSSVPGHFGLAFSRRIEELIRDEVNAFARDLIKKGGG